MKKKISKNGTSATITISPRELDAINAGIGDEVNVTPTENGLLITKVTSKQLSRKDKLDKLKEIAHDYHARRFSTNR